MIQNKSATAVYDCSGTRYDQLMQILFRTTEENDMLEVRLLVCWAEWQWVEGVFTSFLANLPSNSMSQEPTRLLSSQ
ncbi:MAG: hypothetical protein P8N01_03815 [Burkholderiales bacterium]|nr:hypothetical protein [Burkholderiales bacterium]